MRTQLNSYVTVERSLARVPWITIYEDDVVAYHH